MNSQIRAIFDDVINAGGVVGAQLSVIKDGEQSDFVHGVANVELGIPMTLDTSVQIGSTTKVLNAVMLMSLVDEGKIELNVPVKRYIPEFEVSDPKASQTITLRHLLSMSSGVDNGAYGDYGEGQDAIAKRIASLKSLPQHFSPGTHFGYSNAGADIAGYVAERVTGKTWDHLIRERVLASAGLGHAASLDSDRMFQRVSVGHSVNPESGKIEVIRPWAGMSRGLAPAGATLTASAHDLALFGKLFVSKGVADSGTRVLSEDSIKTMMTPQINVPVHWQATSWGLGPCMNKWDGTAVWGHHGGTLSGGSFLHWLPEKNCVIALTFNTPSAFSHLARGTTQEIMSAVCEVANPGIQVPPSPAGIDTKRFTGTYESLAGRCVVGVADGNLVMTTQWDLIAEFSDSCTLLPLGGGRFLIDKGARGDSLGLSQDMAFFGDDGEGRATNLILTVFPFSRKAGQ